MIQINQMKLPVSHTDEDLKRKIDSMLKLHQYQKTDSKVDYSYEIIKKSIDARKKPDIYYIYSVLIVLKTGNEEKIVKSVNNNNIMLTKKRKYDFFDEMQHKTFAFSSKRPVVVGSGPAGLFCAYLLAEAGLKPIVAEQGESVELRKRSVEQFWNKSAPLNPNSNVQFGEGGAGTFSDGKLNTLIKDPCGRNRFVLETFVRFGAKKEILFENKPHLGTDELMHIVKNMREHIINAGGEFRFSTKLTGFTMENQCIKGVCLTSAGNDEQLLTDCVVLAIGHSARDTFRMLQDYEIEMTAKSFAVGLRIEHPQTQINENQYGTAQPDMHRLPPADYKLTYQASNGRSVYSFCMCPGGYVVNASSEHHRLAVNGMSYSRRDGTNANSALIVSVTPKDYESNDPLAGIEFQRRLEEKAYLLGLGAVPIQLYEDYKMGVTGKAVIKAEATHLDGVSPCIKGEYRFAPLHELLPQELNEALVEGIEHFGNIIHRFNRADAILSGVESRTSSPVRIIRDESGQSNIKGLYPCGEGAGYAGGITSAAMDGLKIAEFILNDLQT